MRFVVRLLLALGLVLVLASRASAFVSIDVDLSAQAMRVHSSSGESYVWPISSGRAGHLTPRGVFRPQALYAMVHSAKYGNAPMPHSIFFHGQFAIHGTNAVGSLGRPASHGCIRLSPRHAAELYAMVQSEGAVIRITGDAPTRVAHARHVPRALARAARTLAYAPARHERSLKEWAHNPVGR